jgi:hypothetical protein
LRQPAIDSAMASGSRENRASLKNWLILPPTSFDAMGAHTGKSGLY